MGSFTSTTPDTAGAKAPAASSHADQIQGAAPAAPVSAPATFPAPSSTSGIPDYSHADPIMGVNIIPGDPSDFRIDPHDFPDPSNSPWLNPPRSGANALDPLGGAGGPAASPASAAHNLPAPPPLPPKPAPAPTPAPGLAARVSGNDGQTPIYRPNELEGGGNTKESAAYVQKKNADAAKIAKTEARVEARHAEERAQVARERQKTAERVQRWHAEEAADDRKAQVAQQHKLAKALTAKVKKLMEPAGHPGISDDAKIVQEARRAPLSAEAAAANDRQAKALGRIGGVGDLPVYTADAAENYGDTGINEVADLIHRTAATDPDQGNALLDQTTVRMSDAKADRLRQTVASYKLDDDPGTMTPHDTQLSAGTDDGGDWDEGLSPYEKNKRMFPGFDDEDKPNTYEHLKRQVTDTDTSVNRDIPPYKAGDTPPQTDKGKANFYVHHLDLDPKLTERIKPEDIETFRLLERFRQLDGEGTKALEKRLGDLRDRDPQLFNALNGKRAVALANPGLELWSMSDEELNDAIQRIKTTEPVANAAEFVRDAVGVLRGKGDIMSGVSRAVRDASGQQTQLESWLSPYVDELERRNNWRDQR